MVMGDIVLLEDQVNPVMDVALQNGLEVTALHNHFFWDSPKVMFMHMGGMGEAGQLADTVGKVFARLRETRGGKGRVPRASIDPARSKLDAAQLDALVGQKGTYKDGVYKVTVGRTVRMHGHEMGKAMGVNTWAAFAGTSQQAVVDGDFAMLESELHPVLRALRAANIDVVAIHNHMTGEAPRMMFLHYWGVGPAGSTRARSSLGTGPHHRAYSAVSPQRNACPCPCRHGRLPSSPVRAPRSSLLARWGAPGAQIAMIRHAFVAGAKLVSSEHFNRVG